MVVGADNIRQVTDHRKPHLRCAVVRRCQGEGLGPARSIRRVNKSTEESLQVFVTGGVGEIINVVFHMQVRGVRSRCATRARGAVACVDALHIPAAAGGEPIHVIPGVLRINGFPVKHDVICVRSVCGIKQTVGVLVYHPDGNFVSHIDHSEDGWVGCAKTIIRGEQFIMR